MSGLWLFKLHASRNAVGCDIQRRGPFGVHELQLPRARAGCRSEFEWVFHTASATTSAPPDTQAPTTPTGLFVVAASSNEIDLAWSASTDNIGVTAYVVERCQGAGCSNWSTVATPSATYFNDTSRSGSTSYSYRVSARDAATNTSAPSTAITYLTPASSPDCN